MARMGTPLAATSGGGFRPREIFVPVPATPLTGRTRSKRQLLISADPAYGFSQYFKPIILQPYDTPASIFEILLFGALLLLLIVILGATVIYFLHK